MNAPVKVRSVTNMTSKGQVLIPKDVRDEIGLKPGSPVAVGVNDRGEAVILPQPDRRDETPAQRRVRLLAAIDEVRALELFDGTTEEIMRDLRGDEPLP